MKITEKDFGKTLGDTIELWNQLKVEDDFKQFFLVYKELLRDKTIKESGRMIGDDIRDLNAKAYTTLMSNIQLIISRYSNEMQANYAKKVYWFLW